MIMEAVIQLLFLLSVGVIWFMLVYQGILTFAGYMYSRKKPAAIIKDHKLLPTITIMVPARNEEKVIHETVRHLLGMDYPKEKVELIIINDGSTDKTRQIVEAFNDHRIKLINVPVEESGKGKSRALNIALKKATGELFAVYDADNRPEKESLMILVSELLADKSFVAAIGKFRTINKKAGILPAFENIESLSFQWIIQAGRSFLFDIAILPGTNYVIYSNLVRDLGGWDEGALAEDAELSMRIYKNGGKIKFVPHAVTREQEPESLKVWTRQRERWVRGNTYVMKKLFSEFLHFKNKSIGFEFMGFFLTYYVLFIAMIVSNLFFIFSILNVISVRIEGPFLEVWIMAYMLFVSEIVLTLSHEKNEDTIKNVFYVILMYFSYCQIWLYVVASAFIKDFVKKEKAIWYKTERMAESPHNTH